MKVDKNVEVSCSFSMIFPHFFLILLQFRNQFANDLSKIPQQTEKNEAQQDLTYYIFMSASYFKI